MHITRPLTALAIGLLALLAGATAVRASGASFAISAQGITLGAPEEVVEKDVPQPPRYKARAELGKPFTLSAQGLVFPRGVVKGQPSDPESGKWTFDAKALNEVVPEKKPADTTVVPITLRPTAAGPTRVRFTGKILGYERTFDVLLEVVAPKKD